LCPPAALPQAVPAGRPQGPPGYEGERLADPSIQLTRHWSIASANLMWLEQSHKPHPPTSAESSNVARCRATLVVSPFIASGKRGDHKGRPYIGMGPLLSLSWRSDHFRLADPLWLHPPAVGATLVVAPFVASGNRATTRVAPTLAWVHCYRFHDGPITSDWQNRYDYTRPL